MPQTSSNQNAPPHVLLIGVDDYQSFDASGRSDLKGSRNDVLLLAAYCVEVLDIPVENIVALTTPRLQEDDFEEDASARGITRGDATEDEVRERLARLLDAAKTSPVVLAFSGHGAALPGGEPVLCLGDVAKDFSRGVLSLKQLGAGILQAEAQDRLVALLDCCHVGSSSARRGLQTTSLPHAASREDVAKHEDLFRVSNRVLLAARPGMVAYQMRLGRVWHGALTFALMAAADRWQGQDGVSQGSYRQVLKRARRTLKALGVPQKSELRVPEERWREIGKDPFFGVKAGLTRTKPDAVESRIQLDPNSDMPGVNGTVYMLMLSVGDGTSDSFALSVGKTSGSWRAGCEYWAVSASFAALWNTRWSDSSAPTLRISPKTYSTPAPPIEWNEQTATKLHASVMTGHWVRSSGPPPANTLYFGSFGLTVNFSGGVDWFYQGSSEPPQSYVVSGKEAIFTTTQPTGSTWWFLTT